MRKKKKEKEKRQETRKEKRKRGGKKPHNRTEAFDHEMVQATRLPSHNLQKQAKTKQKGKQHGSLEKKKYETDDNP